MTPYMTVYDNFLGKIRDYKFLSVINNDQELAKNILLNHLRSAIASYTYSDKFEDRDDEKEVFNFSLSSVEIEILAKFMIVDYLTPYLISSNNLENTFSSRELQNFSPANLIKSILEIRTKEQEEAIELMVEEYYRGRA